MGISLKLLLNFLLVEKFQQNGLALSTSISFIFFFASSYLVLNKRLDITDKIIFIKEYCFYFINCCICFIVIYILMRSFLMMTIFTEVMLICIFIALYSLNLFLVKHRSVLLLSQAMKNIRNGGLAKSV